MEWNKETILSFISLIKERPAIWNTQSLEYKMNKRHDAVKEVAMVMGVSAKEVNTKWTILRNQFSREKRKMNGIGAGADMVYSTKWYAYKDMEPLMSNNKPKLSINNCQENGTSAHGSSPPPQIRPPGTPTTPPFSALRKVKKRETNQNSNHHKPADTLSIMRERQDDSSQNDTDELTCFGKYIAAQLRKFSPHLQCKAKYEINTILYKLDMESLGSYGATGSDSVGENDSYSVSPDFKNQRFSNASYTDKRN